MRTIDLGPQLRLPVDIASEACAFLGRRGGGKTYAAGKAAESYLAAGVQIGIIDQVGKWWGLRLGADGKTPMNPELVILGGKKGDVPLAAESGALCAELFASTGRSMIFDVSLFSKTKRKTWCNQFGEKLWELAKAEDSPPVRKIVLEESHLIVPQMIQPDDRQMYGTWEEIIRLGRNHGFGVDLISQRPQSVNKEVLSQVEIVFAFQMNGTTDRKAMQEWISEKGGDKDLVAELPKLKKGDCYVWSPQVLERFDLVRFGAKTTYDSTATAKVGQKNVERPVKPIDLGDLNEKMTAVVEQAKANDPKALKARIVQLEKELTRKAPPAAPERVEIRVPVINEEARRSLTDLLNAVHVYAAPLGALLKQLSDNIEHSERRSFGPTIRAVQTEGPRAVSQVPRVAQWSPSVELSDYATHLLNTLAARRPMKMTRSQLAILSRRSIRSSAFETAVAALSKGGFIETVSGQMSLTEHGESIAPEVSAPETPEQIREDWLKSLPPYERDLLIVLIDSYPQGHDRASLAERSGKSIKSSAFDSAISTLKKNGLATSQAGIIAASDTLFRGPA